MASKAPGNSAARHWTEQVGAEGMASVAVTLVSANSPRSRGGTPAAAHLAARPF